MEKGISKTFLFLLLIMELNCYSQAKVEAVTKSKIETSCEDPIKSANVDDRLSTIESENRDQKHEMSIMKKMVDDDKKTIAHLVTALDEEKTVVNQLKGRIEQLEVSAQNRSPTTEEVIVEIIVSFRFVIFKSFLMYRAR